MWMGGASEVIATIGLHKCVDVDVPVYGGDSGFPGDVVDVVDVVEGVANTVMYRDDVLGHSILGDSESTLSPFFLDRVDSDSFENLVAFHTVASVSRFIPPRSFDLSKAPCSYAEAIARPDAPVWRAAMDREC